MYECIGECNALCSQSPGQTFSSKWGGGSLAFLDFADDLALLSQTHPAIQEFTNSLHEHGDKVGLRIGQDKNQGHDDLDDSTVMRCFCVPLF